MSQKIWMAVVVNDTEAVFSQGCRTEQKACLAIVKYLCKHEDFDGKDFDEACFWIGENDLRMDLMVFEMQTEDFETVQLHRGLLIELPRNEKDAYRVVYTIDILAGSPLKAAKAAHQIMNDLESMAPVLEVISPKGKVTQIDLSQQQ